MLKLLLPGLFTFLWCSTTLSEISALAKPEKQSLKVNVNLVLVPVMVTDPHGRIVYGLPARQFRLWEDKVEQKIEYFSEQDEPLSAGIIFDESNSMQDKMSKARDAAAAFLNSGNSEDEYFLVEFGSRPNLAQNFTRDITRFQNHFLSIPFRGSTALYDAVYLGLDKLKGHSNQRKALLIITDGEDNNSRYTFSDIQEFVKEQDVQIFAIGTLDGAYSSSYGRGIIEDLVELSGGKAFFPKSAKRLEDIAAEIALELRSEYVVGYRPSNEARDGRWRKIRVEVTPRKGMPRLNISTRHGYYASSEESP